jgi:hypothetical protein
VELFTFGVVALVVAYALASSAARRLSWIVWQLLAGLGLAVLVWKIADAAGAFEDEDPQFCSDCAGREVYALFALFGNMIGWAVGTAAGGVVRFVVRRKHLR